MRFTGFRFSNVTAARWSTMLHHLIWIQIWLQMSLCGTARMSHDEKHVEHATSSKSAFSRRWISAKTPSVYAASSTWPLFFLKLYGQAAASWRYNVRWPSLTSLQRQLPALTRCIYEISDHCTSASECLIKENASAPTSQLNTCEALPFCECCFASRNV